MLPEEVEITFKMKFQIATEEEKLALINDQNETSIGAIADLFDILHETDSDVNLVSINGYTREQIQIALSTEASS